MSKCIVCAIKLVEFHPTREDLRVAEANGHQVVVGDHYYDGQLGIHIPDGAIVPDKLAEEMWVLGKLAGNQKNRVKSKKFHGIFSDGLFYGSQGASWNPEWRVGDDVSFDIGVRFE